MSDDTASEPNTSEKATPVPATTSDPNVAESKLHSWAATTILGPRVGMVN